MKVYIITGMDTLDILRQLAIIIIFAKLFGLVARKLHAPQVAGEIIAGLCIGPSLLGWVQSSAFLSGMAEIGVIMLMFNAGLGTNIKDLKKSGLKATLIACAGVAVPFVAGTFLFMASTALTARARRNSTGPCTSAQSLPRHPSA